MSNVGNRRRSIGVITIVLAALAFASANPQTAIAADPAGDAPVKVAGDDSAAAAQAPAPQTADEKPAADQPIPTKSLLGILREGGLVMLPLLACSFVLLVFVFERSISLRRGRVVPGPFVKRFISQLEQGQLDRDQAMLVCEENGSPIARVFSAAAKKWGRPAAEIEQSILDSGERVVHDLRSNLRVFNGIATVSPMLGLMGTVFGMIRAFNDIATADAMGRPELLARGISEALLTTAMGLMVAVPALVLYWWFVSVVDRLTVRIDALGQEVVAVISSEAIQEANAAKPTKAVRAKPAA